jgi:hypothetical protein
MKCCECGPWPTNVDPDVKTCQGQTLQLIWILCQHKDLIYIECSCELVHISAAKTVALQSGAKTVRYLLYFSLGLCGLIFLKN